MTAGCFILTRGPIVLLNLAKYNPAIDPTGSGAQVVNGLAFAYTIVSPVIFFINYKRVRQVFFAVVRKISVSRSHGED